MLKRSLLSGFGAALLLLASLNHALADKRVAIVVGNGAYRHAAALPNPPLDARAMRDMLKRLGFEVVYGEDLDRKQMGQAIARFADIARDSDVALAFFAGHGATFGEIPYLVPVDAEFKNLAAMPFELMPLEGLLGELRQSKGIRLAMIDACRDNEAERDLKRAATRGGNISRGLGRVQSPEGLIIAFATQYGMTAADGPANTNSPFTSAVLKLMPTPGLDVKTMFLDVGREVLQATKGTQRPAIEISLYDAYTLVSPVSVSAPAIPAIPSTFPDTAPNAPPQPAPLAPGPVAVLPPDRPAPARQEPAWTASIADIANWRLSATTRLGGALSRSAASLDGSLIAAAAHRDGTLHVLDAATLKPKSTITLDGYVPYTLGGIALLPDGRRVAVVRKGALEVYDIASRALVQTISAIGTYEKGQIKLGRDGRRLYFVRASIRPQAALVSRFTIGPNRLTPDGDFGFPNRVDSFDTNIDESRFLLGTYPSDELVLYDAVARRDLWSVKCSCSGMFGAGDDLIVFAGRTDGDAGDYGKPSVIGVLDAGRPSRRAIYRTGSKETLTVTDVSPDGRFGAIGATNTGQVTLVPITLGQTDLRPITILKDRSGQSIGGASFVDGGALVTISGDNNARLWRR